MARQHRDRLPEGDDGRTIVDMNVEGMPWYDAKREKRRNAGSDFNELTSEQRRAYRWAAVRAGLAVVLVFGVVFGLFIAFCDFIWFK